MATSRTTNALLIIVGLLLAANLLRPLAEPVTAWAQDSAPKAELAASGNTAWVLKGNQIYYVTFESDFEAIKVYRPEKLDR